MSRTGFAAAVLAAALPFAALAAEPQALQLNAEAQVGGAAVPLTLSASTTNADVVLSPTRTDGATAVTVTLYIAPKPKPQPAAGSSAAAVESSAGIQQSIGGVSPAAEGYSAPVFNAIDSGRTAAARALDSQLAATKARLGPDTPGQVLGSQAVKDSGHNPWGGVLYLLNTLYFYLLTLLRFIVGSVAVCYPVLAALFLWIMWRGFRLVRRPA